jgi:hypothetical protein
MSMLNCNVAPRRFVSHALHFSDPQPRRCKQPMEVTAEKLCVIWGNTTLGQLSTTSIVAEV